jgi:hypothetical protein
MPTFSDVRFVRNALLCAIVWGEKGFSYREHGQPACWEALGGRAFFADVLRGSMCHRNWMEGAFGKGEDNLVRFPQSSAPALLGFDDTIWSYCSQAIGQGGDLGGFSQQKLAARCVESNNNILRIVGGRWEWNMCQNLAWQLCAVSGRLPGQGGKRLRFSSAPKSLSLQEWEHPTSWPCDHGPCPQGKFAIGDVFFVELAILRTICRNAQALFVVAAGQTMECELDVVEFERLATRLLATRRRD